MIARPAPDDILVFGSADGQHVDTRELDLAVMHAQQMATHLESGDAALTRLIENPHFTIGPHLPFPLPGEDPVWTWAEVEHAVERARFGPGGVLELATEISSFRAALAAVGASYAEAEAAISRSFRLGVQIGSAPGPELLWFLLAVNDQTAAHAGFDVKKLAENLVRYGTVPGLYFSAVRPADRQEVLGEIAAVLAGDGEISVTPEEFIATLFGIYGGLRGAAASRLALDTGFVPAPPLGVLAPGVLERAISAAAVDSERGIRLERLSRSASSSPPRTLADLAERVNEQYTENPDAAQFTIEMLAQPDGHPAARVYLPGTAHALLHESHPNDARGNIQAIQGIETEQARGVKAALAQLGLPPGTRLAISGHSKGGIDALNLATDPEIQAEYDVVSVETFGAPTEMLAITDLTIRGARSRTLPKDTQFLSLTHSGDPVPGFDLTPPRGAANKTEIRLSEKPALEGARESPISAAHSITTYRASAARLENAPGAPLAHWQAAAAPTLAQPGTKSRIHVYEVHKLPR